MKQISFLFIFLIYYFSLFAQTGTDTILSDAVKENNFNKVKQLVDNGANVNAVDSNNASLLMWSVYKSDLETIKYLIDKGASFNNNGVIYLNKEKTSYYGNALGIAAGEGKFDILKYLIEVGKINIEDKEYDPEAKIASGWTALQWAASSGKINEAKYLIEKGANINADHTADKGTPLTYALQNNKIDVAALLIEKGADVNKTLANGATALMYAAVNKNFETCVLLWKHNANLSFKDNNGKTALDYAIENGPSRVLDFLKTPDAYLFIAKKEYWPEMQTMFTRFFSADEFEQAIPFGIKSVSAAKKEKADTTLQYALFLKQLAKCYVQTKQYGLADNYYTSSLSLLRKKLGIEDKEYYTLLYVLQNYYENTTKEYDKALLIYEDLLETAKAIVGDKDDIYITKLQDLAKFYQKTGDYSNAEIAFLKIIDIRKEVKSDTSSDYSDALLELGNFYSAAKKYNKAIITFQNISTIVSIKYGDKSQEYAAFLSKLASLHFENQDTLKAEQTYIKAIGILNYDKSAQVIIKKLIDFYIDQKIFVKAEPLYKKIIEIEKRFSGDTAEQYFDKVLDLAAYYDDVCSRYDKAEPLYLQVKDFRLKTNGENSTNYGYILNAMAIMYKADKQYQKAEALYKKVTEIYKEKVGGKHLYYGITLSNQADLYNALGNYEKATSLYKQVLEIRKTASDTSPEYLSTLKNIASVYYKSTQYNQVEPLYIQLSELHKKKFGERSNQYANSINDLGLLFTDMRQYGKAEYYFLIASDIYKPVKNEPNKNYAIVLVNMGQMYESMGLYDTAEALFIKVIDIRKKLFGEKNENYISAINELAKLYITTKKFDKAEKKYLLLIEIAEKNYGKNSAEYAKIIFDLAGVYANISISQKAENFYLEALRINKILGEGNEQYFKCLEGLSLFYLLSTKFNKVDSLNTVWLNSIKNKYGEEHPEYAKVLDQQSGWYNYMGMYEKAEKYSLKASEIFERVLGPENPLYTASLNQLASLYEFTDEFSKAELIYLKIAAIRKRILGERHPDYANSLDKLANLYLKVGQTAKAEIYLVRALEILQKNLGEENKETLASMEKLAAIYRDIGENEKGKLLAKKALAIAEKIFGKNDVYAGLLRLLASMYQNKQQYKEAEPLLVECVTILESSANAFYALTLGLLADLYSQTNEFEKAEKLYNKSIDAWDRVFGKGHIAYALALNTFGKYYSKTGKYDKAEKYYEQATAVAVENIGKSNPGISVYLRNLAFCYQDERKFEAAEPVFSQIKDVEVKNLLAVFANLSEKEKGIFVDSKLTLNSTLNSFLYNFPAARKEFIQGNYNLQLLLKSLTLADTKNVMESVRNSSDSITQKIFNDWQANKIILAKQYALPVATRRNDLQQIEEQTEDIEKQLALRSTSFRNQQKSLQLKFTDVQNGLQPDEAAVEFVRFDIYDKKWTNNIIYAAYVLRKNDSTPLFIPLCREKELQELFTSAGKNTTALVSSFYRGVGAEDNNVSLSKGDSLYKLIWQPLEPYLKEIKKVSYSPVGKLYTVAFNALPIGDKKVLMDKYELQQYTSTRQIAVRNNIKAGTPKSIVLFGDASFTMDSLQLVKNEVSSAQSSSTSLYTPSTRGGNDATWSILPGTADEVKKIQQLFVQNKISTKIFTQTKASEENLKLLTGNAPQVLHIATHGFFLPEPEKKVIGENEGNTYSLATDPLLRSGLILSGGNYAWSGKTPINGVEDGIVTAYEISQLDLSKTDLIVLSACETALGDIKGSEGVFGLQRSFKMAGVKKLIVSLWQVPDKETAELMTTFYTDWLKGNTIENSFYKAQSEMRKKYSPFYWAAFVLVE